MKQKNCKGQSFLELVFTMFAFLTILFMFIQVAVGLGIANFIQYATFMASRALLSGYRTEADQQNAARETLKTMLAPDGRPRFGNLAQPVGGGDPPGVLTLGRGNQLQLARPGVAASLGNNPPREWAWQQGVSYQFKLRLNLLPPVPGTKNVKAEFVELKSESWLGRDPSQNECEEFLRQRARSLGIGNPFIYDNGC